MPEPDKNTIKTKYDEYNNYLTSSIRGNDTAGNKAKNLKNLQYYLKKLNKEIARCYERDLRNQYMPIGRDRLKKMKSLYKLCDYYASKAEKKVRDKKLTGTLVSQLHKILKEDEAYVNCLSENDVFPEKFRRNVVALESKKLGHVGVTMNTRNPITYIDENKNKVFGFFTETSANDSVKEEEINKFRKIKADLQGKIKDSNFQGSKKTLRKQLNDMIDAWEADADKNRAMICDKAGIGHACNITDRNCAMTQIANLLGLNRLLAASHSMTVYDTEGRERKGVFMETGKGIRYDNLCEIPRFQDALQQMTRGKKAQLKLSSPTLKKDLADMQILDFICGNIDRHQENMTYIFDNDPMSPKLIGIQGIDNDLSMGTINPTDKGNSRLPALKYMYVISESLAAKIKAMKKEDLEYVLKGLALTEEEIAAAWKRTTEVKTRLKTAHKLTSEDRTLSDEYITIVPEGGYECIGFDNLCTPKNCPPNYYNNMLKIPELLYQKTGQIDPDEVFDMDGADKVDKVITVGGIGYATARLTRFAFSKEVIAKNKVSIEKFRDDFMELARNSKTNKIEIEGVRTSFYKNVLGAVDKLAQWYESYDEYTTDKNELKKLYEDAARACQEYIQEHNPHSAMGKKRQKAVTEILEFVGTQGIMINEYHEYIDKKLEGTGRGLEDNAGPDDIQTGAMNESQRSSLSSQINML